MDKVCSGMEFIFVYLDVIFVANSMSAEHYDHLWQLFAAHLVEQGLVVHMAKCEFEKPILKFLRHCIDKHGASPLPSKMQAVNSSQHPIPSRACKSSSVGLHYHRFLPHGAAHSNLYSHQ